MSGEPENNDQSASANVKVHITRIGKAIQVVCAVVRVLAVVLVVLSLAGIAMLYAGIGFGDTLSTLAGNSTFVQIVDATIDEETIPARELGMINLFAFTLSQLVFLAFISVLSGLTRDITENEKPFRVETAKQLRRNTFWLVLLIFWNFLAGIIILLIALLLSYLIEYGAYLQEKADETTRIQEQVIVSLAEITENKSGQTGQHVRRVAEYTRILADELGYPEEQIDNIRLASTMHDIGKLLVPTEILEKPGRLTDEEFSTIKQHTTDGGRLLENVDGDVMHLSRTIALDHHERWDGNGYAQEKAGEDISFEGRIVAVADVYDALTSRRSYKEAWDDRDAYNEIVRCSGTQFDPQVVEAFKRRYDDINAVRLQLADPAA
ncbi:MAG: HD-GYP domain-containing protein [Eggerthellaceae bacterium]|nr:HD-GYP domain-containing protein [Eggerthellaceae bacterium]